MPRPADPAAAVVKAVEDELRPALERSPCVIAFSGGRDSSILLAVADRLARREGLPRPVALTARFPGAPRTVEDDWQERVIRHVGVEEWERFEPTDEMEGLGPLTMDTLRRHGPLFPPNLGLLMVTMRRATGGALVDGLGGDDVLGWAKRRRVIDLVTGRGRPRPSDARAIASTLAPLSVRRRLTTYPVELPWLAPEAWHEWKRAIADDLARSPTGYSRWLRWVVRRRYLHLAMHASALLARDADVELVRPFLSRRFIAALSAAGGWRGFGDRSATCVALFGELLPAAVLERSTKAYFNDVYKGPLTRAKAHELIESGELAVPDLIDREGLRAAWSMEQVPFSALLVVQASLLAAERRVSSV